MSARRGRNVLFSAAALAVLALLVWLLLPGSVGSDETTPSTSTGGPTADRPPRLAAQRPQPPANELPSDLPAATDPRAQSADAAVASSSTASDVTDAAVALDAAPIEAWLKKNASEAERAVDHFCDENRRLAKKKLFEGKGEGERDAAAYLLPRVDWEQDVRPPGLLHLPEALRQRIQAAGTAWPTQLTIADTTGLDFTWLRELRQFNVWTAASFGPLRDDQRGAFFTAPIPNYVSLMQWAKLRFIRAFADGDFLAADAEVRHLAMLIQSQGLLIADVVAASILQSVARARAQAAAGGRDVALWPPVDVDETQRFRRVALAGPFFFLPGVSEAVVKKARACAVSPCAALSEGLGLQAVLGPFLASTNKDAVEAAAADAPCSKQLFDRIRDGKPGNPSVLFPDLQRTNRISELFGDAGVPSTTSP